MTSQWQVFWCKLSGSNALLERKRWSERFHSHQNLTKINPKRFYGIILDSSLSPAFPPWGQRHPFLGRRQASRHYIQISGSTPLLLLNLAGRRPNRVLLSPSFWGLLFCSRLVLCSCQHIRILHATLTHTPQPMINGPLVGLSIHSAHCWGSETGQQLPKPCLSVPG